MLLLKRIYDPDSVEKWRAARARLEELAPELTAARRKGKKPADALVAEERRLLSVRPIVRAIRLRKAGRIQRLTPTYIANAKREGWLREADGEFVIAHEKGELVFRIVTPPGLYCCHCGQPQGDGATAREHVATDHEGTTSPDPQNPSGYRQDNFFETLLAGEEFDDLSEEEAAEMLAGARESLIGKISKKYGDTRGAAERRNAAKVAAGGPSNV